MRGNRPAALRRDGKFAVGGRASFVWETFLMSRAAGVPGNYEIRAERGKPWHRLNWSVEEAEAALAEWGRFGPGRVRRAQATRAGRARRGLPVG